MPDHHTFKVYQMNTKVMFPILRPFEYYIWTLKDGSLFDVKDKRINLFYPRMLLNETGHIAYMIGWTFHRSLEWVGLYCQSIYTEG